VRVIEFAMGMGPKLLSFGKKETKYTLRLLPIGGFCAMEGEDPDTPMPRGIGGRGLGGDTDDAEKPAETDITTGAEAQATEGDTGDSSGKDSIPAADGRAFFQKKVWQRMIIMVAGAAMNLLLGFVLLLAYFAFLSPANSQGEVLYGTTTIARLPEESPAYQTSLRPGDTIMKIDGRRMYTHMDLQYAMQNSPTGIFSMTVRRTDGDGKSKTETLPAVAFEIKTDENGQRYLVDDIIWLGVHPTFTITVSQAAKMEFSVGVLVWRTLGDLFTGRYGLNDLSGPVGTVSVIGDVVGNAAAGPDLRAGLGNIFMLVVMITVNVGIFNLLPIPGLDGGRIIFLLIEAVARKPVPRKYEGIIHLVGLALLMLLMLVVTFSDVRKLIGL
jgi:regulator of sigma E protease